MTNGEYDYFKTIPSSLVLFDVGSRDDSVFEKYEGEVHYFEPVSKFLESLKSKTKNKISFFNNFGLSDTDSTLYYYPNYQSFHNRITSCGIDDSSNKIELKVSTGKKYIDNNKIEKIDFLKIDTEGHELAVLKGFAEKLNIVNVIQFEYGGTYLDSNIKLIDVIDYLKSYGFNKFSYIIPNGLSLITDFSDHYQYCNILCER